MAEFFSENLLSNFLFKVLFQGPSYFLAASLLQSQCLPNPKYSSALSNRSRTNLTRSARGVWADCRAPPAQRFAVRVFAEKFSARFGEIQHNFHTISAAFTSAVEKCFHKFSVKFPMNLAKCSLQCVGVVAMCSLYCLAEASACSKGRHFIVIQSTTHHGKKKCSAWQQSK